METGIPGIVHRLPICCAKLAVYDVHTQIDHWRETVSNDLDRLQGSWTVTTLEVDGQKMSRDMFGNAQVRVKGGRFVSTGMGVEYEGTIEVDPLTRPRKLTLKFDAGPEKGNSNLAIYELKDDTWKLCIATRGDVRPTRFATKPGSGFALETLVRGDVR